jgi:single-strand DNA-binding protein
LGPTGDRVSLRVVATERRFDRAADDWVNGDEFGVTVVCWKTLATAVLNTVRKGDPVIVAGRIATRRFEKEGVTQYFTEVKADFFGLDVAKAGTRFTRNPLEPREPAETGAQPAEVIPGPVDGSLRPDDLVEPQQEGDLDGGWAGRNGAGVEHDASMAAG